MRERGKREIYIVWVDVCERERGVRERGGERDILCV